MNFIMSWLYKALMETLGDIIVLIGSVSGNLFTNSIVSGVLAVMQLIGGVLWGIGVLVLLNRLALQVMDDQRIHIGDTIKRILLSAIVTMFGTRLTIGAYKVLNDFSSTISGYVSGMTNVPFSMEGFDMLGIVIQVILLCIVLWSCIKVIIQVSERFWHIFVQLITMYFSNMEFLMGNDGSIGTWFKNTLSIMLTQIFQVLVLCIGINIMLSDKGIVGFMISAGSLTAAAHMEQLLDKWGRSVGQRSNMISSVYQGSMIVQNVSRILR